MKTVKEVSELTGVSIRSLRYYDQIGLLKPSAMTDAGYRLYDNHALEKLQQILFFKELEIPLADVKRMMEDPEYDKEQMLVFQRAMLVNKRNHINGLIELIDDVKKGVNTMSFEAFNESDIKKMVDHTIKCMSEEMLKKEVEKHGSLEEYKSFLAMNLNNEQAVADLIKWYGSKEKAVEAVLSATGKAEDVKKEQDKVGEVYQEFIRARKEENDALTQQTVEKLAECYKSMFQLDNARAILIDLAKEYLRGEKLAEATDEIYGEGSSKYIGEAILKYYGV